MKRHIYGLILQKAYIARRSLEVFIDTIWFSVLSVVIFGFLSSYLNKSQNIQSAYFLLVGILFWEVIRINQYSLALHPLWNIWSRNFANLFIAPITRVEYLTSQIIGAFFETLFVFLLNALIANVFFGFNVFSFGVTTVFFYFINLSLFAWSFGLVMVGIIFMYGTRIQALAWGFIFLLQPLMAVFFPVSVLPKTLQYIAYILPPTYIFESARAQVATGIVHYDWITTAFLFNLVYFVVCVYLFNVMFNISQHKGQFAKNDEG